MRPVRADTPPVTFGNTDRAGASARDSQAEASLQAREPAHRPETAAERRARRTAYLDDWPNVMREHAKQLREREGR